MATGSRGPAGVWATMRSVPPCLIVPAEGAVVPPGSRRGAAGSRRGADCGRRALLVAAAGGEDRADQRRTEADHGAACDEGAPRDLPLGERLDQFDLYWACLTSNTVEESVVHHSPLVMLGQPRRAAEYATIATVARGRQCSILERLSRKWARSSDVSAGIDGYVRRNSVSCIPSTIVPIRGFG